MATKNAQSINVSLQVQVRIVTSTLVIGEKTLNYHGLYSRFDDLTIDSDNKYGHKHCLN